MWEITPCKLSFAWYCCSTLIFWQLHSLTCHVQTPIISKLNLFLFQSDLIYQWGYWIGIETFQRETGNGCTLSLHAHPVTLCISSQLPRSVKVCPGQLAWTAIRLSYEDRFSACSFSNCQYQSDNCWCQNIISMHPRSIETIKKCEESVVFTGKISTWYYPTENSPE